MTSAEPRVLSVNTARVSLRSIGGRNVATAIAKRPRDGAVAYGPLGLEGDEQAAPSVHGGLAKALYAYPSEHFPVWQTMRAQAKAADWGEPIPPGLMGENLTLAGLLEKDLWVGDRLCFEDGGVLVVSEPRRPCFKFNAAMGFAQAAKLMQESGWCGFYLAVLQPGRIQAGGRFTLQAGPREMALAELVRARKAGPAD